jgi:hypothetical protein
MNTKILTIIIILIGSAASAQAAQIWVEPSSIEAANGTDFTVNIMVDPETHLTDDPINNTIYAAQYFLRFDNTLLSAIEQIQGDFLSQDGATSIAMPNNINETGFTEYGETRILVQNGVNDSGVLASITFHVINDQGTCELGLYNVILCNNRTVPISDVVISNGSVEILSANCGNVNGDGYIDIEDVILLRNYVGYPDFSLYGNGDVCDNGDGLIDISDVIRLANYVGYSGYELDCAT